MAKNEIKIGEKKSSPLGNILFFLILIAALGVMAFAGWNLFTIYSEYKAGTDEYDKIHNMVVTERDADEEEIPEVQRIEVEQRSWKAPIEVDFQKLLEINTDIVGWLYVEALPNISYPIVKGEDNNYYLHRTYERQDNFAGTLFIDCENERDLDNCNTILYGHNMKNGSMFGTLKNFKLPETVQKSNVVWILTPMGDYKYEVFSAYTAGVDSETYTLIKGPGQELVDYANKMQENSIIDLPHREFKITDRILTLSTCTGNEKTRFVVQCVRIEP